MADREAISLDQIERCRRVNRLANVSGPTHLRGGDAMIDHPAYAAASPEVRAAALALLDEISGPILPHVIERRFQDCGLTRGQARKAKNALGTVNVIALVPR